MDIALEKIDLASKILAIQDVEMINHIKAALESGSDNWYDELPDEIKDSITKGLSQSARGETLPHAEVMKRFEKWSKK
jgi:predicted transcriptional regulator